jgi:thiamine-phosphate pyrophosphorylase
MSGAMNDSLHLDRARVAQEIVAAHGLRFGAATSAPAAAIAYSADDAIYRGARQACGALGFIDIDAECIARAWRAQSERLGGFDAQRWPDAPADFGLREFPPAARDNAFAPCPEQLGLYAVLPDAAWVGRMARAGVPTVQLRFKSEDAAAVAREVHAAVAAVQGTDALLFINDHWRVAIEARAYGVHLGQEDLDALAPEELQRIRAAGLRLGVSTHGYAEMVRADAVGPSYIAMGAVYPTTLKKMATAPQGVARLAAYARLLRGYPQVGIGGIDALRLPEVLATGVGSVAVVRALVAAEDPEGTAAQWMAAIDAHRTASAAKP